MAQTLWVGDEIPTNANEAEGAPGIATGHTCQFDVPGTITGIQARLTTTKGGTYVGRVWEPTVADDDPGPDGDELAVTAAVDAADLTAGAFNIIPLLSPVVVTEDDLGRLYRFDFHNNQGRYCLTAGIFTSAPRVAGNITAYQNGTDPNPPGLGGMRQGSFQVGAAGVYPGSSGNGAAYFVGPVFEPAGTPSGTADIGLALAVAAAGRKVAAGLAGLGLQLTIAASGRKKARGTAALTLGLQLTAGLPSVSAPPAKLTARARSSALTARGQTPGLTARGGYADA